MAVWDDAVFLWHPGDAETASFDMVTEVDADGSLTEGSTVTNGDQTGRAYVGAVGSRFASPIDNLKTTSWTMMCVTRSTENGIARSFNFANSADSDQWAGIWAARNDAARAYNFRLNGSASQGGNDWPSFQATDQTTSAPYVNVMRYTRTDDSNGTLEGFVDSTTAFGSDTLASASVCAPDRLTVGRLEDSSPSNSGSGQVYAAAVWDRAITEAEIAEILDDPYVYQTADPPAEGGYACVLGTGVW